MYDQELLCLAVHFKKMTNCTCNVWCRIGQKIVYIEETNKIGNGKHSRDNILRMPHAMSYIFLSISN